MQLPGSALKLFCLVLLSAILACQQPAPPPLEGEALKQRQQQIALESREIVQQIRDSLEADLTYHDSSIYARNRARSDSIEREWDKGKDECGAYSYRTPSRFPGLPARIANWLESRGYTIPQIYSPLYFRTAPEFENVNAISGNFQKNSQLDWAVYCNNDSNAAIIIFYAQDTLDIQQVLHLPDSTLINCCNLSISRADKNMILEEPYYMERLSSTLTIEHDGIYISDQYYPLELIYDFEGTWIQMAPFYD